MSSTFLISLRRPALAVLAIALGTLPARAEPAAKTVAVAEPATTEAPSAPATGTPAATNTPAAAETPAATTTPPTAVTPPAVPEPATAQQPATPPAIAAVRAALSDKSVTRAHADDIAALEKFYETRSELQWARESGWTDSAKSIIGEIRKADDYGLDASAFDVPDLGGGANADAQGAAEAKLGVAALKYARFARGGRVNPLSVSNIWDMTPEIKDPSAVLAELAASASPDKVLRGLHPQHPEFEGLRQALLKARGPAPEPVAVDPALLVKLPVKGAKQLKPGIEHDDVALLRKRLKIDAATEADARKFDDGVKTAVEAFQVSNGLKANGIVNLATRRALNSEGEPKAAEPRSEVDRLIVNMERWRWLPADMGKFYVANNIPEFVTRVVKDGSPVFQEKIIVGLSNWPTPMMADSMERIVFNPEWGMPDGIKMKELLPRLRRASGGDDFFSQMFGGGSSGGGRVLQAYGLRPSLNGRPIDGNSVNWNNVDIRRYSFVQPAGATNPLGIVKFLFPNRHDVYMHDTPQRTLFAQSRRALSHGCIRVENPMRLAEVLLAHDKGWSVEQVRTAYRSGPNDNALKTPIPVYLMYFTARPGADGKIVGYTDIYGHDGRVLSALSGKAVRYEAPDVVADAGDDGISVVADESDAPPAASSKKRNRKSARNSGGGPGDIISDALSGLMFN